MNNDIQISNVDGLKIRNNENNSIDLTLEDLPYIISKESGMNEFEKTVKKIEKDDKNAKTKKNGKIIKQKII